MIFFSRLPFFRAYYRYVLWVKLSSRNTNPGSSLFTNFQLIMLDCLFLGFVLTIISLFSLFFQGESLLTFIKYAFLLLFYIIRLCVLVVLITIPFLSIPKTSYNLSFSKSKWWRNTEVSVKEIIEDQGIYGEYVATVAAELNMKQNKMYGEIFNNVIVPKKDGDFNEIDVIMICEAGIFVIEAKARGGEFSGTGTSDIWQQTMGNEVHELPNPFIQNLGHCNYLTEYLHEKLPAHIRSQIDLRRIMVNTVLFGMPCDLSKISMEKPIRPSYFTFAIQHKNSFLKTNLVNTYGRNLTPEQIDAIANALRPISFYPKQTREQMINERQFRQEHGDFRHAFSYYIANGVWSAPYQGSGTMICRDNGLYKTYLEMEDHQFHAYPNFQVTGITYRSRNLDDVVQEYYRRRG